MWKTALEIEEDADIYYSKIYRGVVYVY